MAAAPAAPAKSKCDTFLEIRSTDGFTIRAIDETIHKPVMKVDEEYFSEIVDKYFYFK